MSAGLTNSKFLQYILACAEKIKEERGSKIFSANHVFAAIMQYRKDSTGYVVTDDDREEIEAVLELINSVVDEDNFEENIEKIFSSPETYLEDLQYRNQINIANKINIQRGKDFITAEVLLKCIIESPTKAIKRVMENEKPEKTDSASKGDNVETVNEAKKEDSENKLTEDDVKTAINVKEEIAEMTAKVKKMQKQLGEIVFGQENAIDVFAEGYFQSELRRLTTDAEKKPKATFLFAGPPGVGKTFLAQQVAPLLGLPFMRFDMSDFAGENAVAALTGIQGNYHGACEGQLTGFVRENPACVLLFDEIEKANIFVIHLFLQILDAGQLRDSYTKKEIDFTKTVIIFTTNAGRAIYEDSNSLNLSQISRKTIIKALESDVDPKTGRSAFPAAICSRFATGNVVMFNHMQAHYLRGLVEKEINKRASAFEEKTGIKVSVSEDVYSCILFAEGGHIDARTVKSRAKAFVDNELYELFRLISTEKNNYDIKNIEEICIDIDLSECEADVMSLFGKGNTSNILIFADEHISEKAKTLLRKYNVISTDDPETARKLVAGNEYDIIMCDLNTGKKCDCDSYLNIEDSRSAGRAFFRYICEKTDNPLYIVQDSTCKYSDEEMLSLKKDGARGLLDVDDASDFEQTIAHVITKNYQQASMINLARASKLITYETGQFVSEEGKYAGIRIFDIKMTTAVSAEDSGKVLDDLSKPNVRLDDVIGADGAKEELNFFIEYLKNPKEFTSRGLKPPKGVLFYGPPGTGKTMLAKAVAGESDVTFISAEGNQFFSKYYGESEESVHKMFSTARKYAPSIIFIDELDAFAKERTGEDELTERILTAFLAEMDGFKTDPKKPVLVLGATNYDITPGTKKSLDGAFLRRFDRLIYVELPDKKARIRYIRKQISESPIFDLSEAVIESIAVRSSGMSLANLAQVFEFSLRIAFRNKLNKIGDDVFEEAFETYNHGEEKTWDESELRKTAYHEAGHALLCWYSGEIPSFLTVVARGNHGGYMQHGDNESKGCYTKRQLLDRVRTSLGGRAAEVIYYGDDGFSTGASSDLKSATYIARSMVCDYGMDDHLGLAVLSDADIANGDLAKEVRVAVNAILAKEMEDAKRIISENKPAMDAIVDALLKEDHLNGQQIDDIFSQYIKREN